MTMKQGETRNPMGRPKGLPDKRDIYNLIKEDLPAILEKLTKLAKEGDAAAARLLLERSVPVMKPEHLAAPIPIGGNTPLEKAESVIKAVTEGAISPAQAQQTMQLIGAAAQIAASTELLRRVEDLEQRLASAIFAGASIKPSLVIEAPIHDSANCASH